MNIAARNAEIVAAIARNVPRGLLADRYGITPTRIGQIVKAHGVCPKRAKRGESASSWTADEVSALTLLWGVTSASVIAETVGRSRNAIIGKAARLGLARLQPGRRAAS